MPFEGVESGTQPIRSSWDTFLQRLFSTFPNSWPGAGLLVLRVCLGIAVIYFGIARLSREPSESITMAKDLSASVGGIFLLAGLWTPVVGAIVALDEVWIGLSLHAPRQEDTWIHIFLGVLSVGLAMLGPGAWSIDARLFGRRRFDIDRTKGRRTSS